MAVTPKQPNLVIIVIVKKELLGAMFAIVVTDHQVHWLANALFERIESSIRLLKNVW